MFKAHSSLLYYACKHILCLTSGMRVICKMPLSETAHLLKFALTPTQPRRMNDIMFNYFRARMCPSRGRLLCWMKCHRCRWYITFAYKIPPAKLHLASMMEEASTHTYVFVLPCHLPAHIKLPYCRDFYYPLTKKQTISSSGCSNARIYQQISQLSPFAEISQRFLLERERIKMSVIKFKKSEICRACNKVKPNDLFRYLTC